MTVSLLVSVIAMGVVLIVTQLVIVKRVSRPAEASQSPPQPADLIGPLDSRVKSLETGMKSLELEWSNAYEKLRKVAGRIDVAKRKDRQPDGDVEEPQTEMDALRLVRQRAMGQ